MEKFSVIIPTMWKSEYLDEMLKKYSECEYVGEIILIDNAPQLKKNIQIPKVRHLIQKQNIFVNPSWNLGVYLSKFNNITIANDDILYNADEYFKILGLIDKEKDLKKLGIIGMHSKNYELDKNEDYINIELYSNKNNNGGWGCLFSLNKQNWRWIPDELKVWYGDNWLHLTIRPVLQLVGFKVETKMSSTSELEIVSDVKKNDTKEWQKIYKILVCAGLISA